MQAKTASALTFSVILIATTVASVMLSSWYENSADEEKAVEQLMSDSGIKPEDPNPLLKLKAQSEAAKAATATDASARIIYSISQIQTKREAEGKPALIESPVSDLETAAAWMEALAKEVVEQ